LQIVGFIGIDASLSLSSPEAMFGTLLLHWRKSTRFMVL